MLFRRSSLLLAFYFYNHGLQRVWRCQTISIQRIRCLWLNVCCSLCYRIFPDAEDGELDGSDALIHPLILGGVESHVPFVESVGRAKHVHEFRTEELRFESVFVGVDGNSEFVEVRILF